MRTHRSITELQHLRYWQGQKLRSRDMTDQIGIEAEYRWWHNRALHSAYGVIEGLQVELVTDETGQIVAVQVQPGLGYDAFGREVMLQEIAEIAVPDTGHDSISLLAAYQETLAYRPAQERPGVPIPSCDLPREAPRLCWQVTDDVRAVDGILLATLENGVLTAGLRPNARPAARPHIVQGETSPGNTAWELWTDLYQATASGGSITFSPGNLIPMQVVIDTSPAGFTETPCYFASMQFAITGKDFPAMVHLEHIAEPSATGFVFRVLFSPILLAQGVITKHLARSASSALNLIELASVVKAYVSWIGIEHNS